MVTREELEDAIRDCESAPPSYDVCRKLAVFYSVWDHLYGDEKQIDMECVKASQKNVTKTEELIGFHGNSEFLRMISGMEASDVWAIMDELMETLSIVNPRLYDGVLRRINSN